MMRQCQGVCFEIEMNERHPNDRLPDRARGREFLRLYQANERRIFGFILTLVPQWSEAEDLLQESTMTMWSKFDTFEAGTDFAAWALCIARYRVMNHRRKQRNQRVQFSDEVLEALDERVRRATTELDTLREALGSCLRKLPDRDRDLIQLRYEYGATTRSVAQRIGRSTDAVYKALNRIHVQLLYCIRRTLALERSA
jgi:RNA polymerase sigma-70 factor, ECF subfamily